MSSEAPALETTEPVPQKYNWRLSLWVGIYITAVSLLAGPSAGPFFDLYEQIKVPMPDATETLKTLHRIIVGYPTGWIFLGFSATFAAGFARPRRKRIARLVLLIVALVSLLWILWALLMPLTSVMDGSGGRRGRR